MKRDAAHWIETHRRADAVARKYGHPRACPVALIRLHAVDPGRARAEYERSRRLDEDTRWALEDLDR